MSDKDDAINFLYDFINEEVLCNSNEKGCSNKNIDKKEFVRNNVDKLIDFSFWNIRNKDKYFYKEYADDKDIDGDRTKISYVVYYLLWGEEIAKYINSNTNEYTPNNFINTKNHSQLDIDFSGDTICTFNTLFSKNAVYWFLRENISFGKAIKIDNLKCFTFDELKTIHTFLLQYQSLGNFYLLPKRTFKRKSINMYRGDINNWKDYFDTFLFHLENEFNGVKDDKDFHELIKLNDFFFGKDKVDSLDEFKRIFNLEDFDEYKLQEHYNYKFYETDQKAYHDFAMLYVYKSKECIKHRADKLKDILKNKLE